MGKVTEWETYKPIREPIDESYLEGLSNGLSLAILGYSRGCEVLDEEELSRAVGRLVSRTLRAKPVGITRESLFASIIYGCVRGVYRSALESVEGEK